MSQIMKIHRGDTVLIIAGKERGKTGTVEAVFPRLHRAVVTGLNMYKKHLKPSSKHPSGGISEFARPLHISNLMILEAETKKPSRVGYEVKNKEKTRIAQINKQPIKRV
jgi:large subunit ribosomal protein L24